MLKDLEDVGVDRGGRKIEDAEFGREARRPTVQRRLEMPSVRRDRQGRRRREVGGEDWRGSGETNAEKNRPSKFSHTRPTPIPSPSIRGGGIRTPASDPQHPPCDSESKPPNAHVRRFLTMGSPEYGANPRLPHSNSHFSDCADFAKKSLVF